MRFEPPDLILKKKKKDKMEVGFETTASFVKVHPIITAP